MVLEVYRRMKCMQYNISGMNCIYDLVATYTFYTGTTHTNYLPLLKTIHKQF